MNHSLTLSLIKCVYTIKTQNLGKPKTESKKNTSCSKLPLWSADVTRTSTLAPNLNWELLGVVAVTVDGVCLRTTTCRMQVQQQLDLWKRHTQGVERVWESNKLVRRIGRELGSGWIKESAVTGLVQLPPCPDPTGQVLFCYL